MQDYISTECCEMMMQAVCLLFALAHHEVMWAMCSEHLELWKGLMKLEVRGVEQDLIPYIEQLKLPGVPVEGWIIGPIYVASLQCCETPYT